MTTTEFINRLFFITFHVYAREKSKKKHIGECVIAEDNKWGIVIHEVV